MLVDRFLNKIYDEAEEEFRDKGVTRKQIEDIFVSLWRSVHDIIASGQFAVVYLPKFGRFKPKLNAMRKYAEYLESKGDKEKADFLRERADYIYKNRRTRND